ncbi:MAG TPA: hypothetical protein VJK54_09835 [Chthoniobacterales bacterium]|nr:hypothetical protein [Chthoniobacterales bacterium]
MEKNQQDLLENEGLAVNVTTTPVLVAGMVYGNTIVDAPTVTVHSFINASPDTVMMILRNGHKFATNCTYTLNKTAPIDHNITTNQENYKIKAPFIGDLSMDLKRTFTTLDHNEGYTMEWNSEKVNIGIQETSGSVQVVPYHGGTLVCCKLSVTPTAMAATTMNTAGITPETLPEKVLGTIQRINDQIKDFV